MAITPPSPGTWSAFDALVQRHNGFFGDCWCMWFHPDGPERGRTEANRALKKAYVEQGKGARRTGDGRRRAIRPEYGTGRVAHVHHRTERDATKTADPDYWFSCAPSTSATGDGA